MKHINMRKFFLFVWEIVKVVAISLAIILPVRYYLIQPFYVKGASMEPNFHDGQYLIIDEISYRFHEPERGQVIVFRYPRDPQEYFIKRIIGLPGETIQLVDGKIKIYNSQRPEGFFLEESYISSGVLTFPEGADRMTVGPDQYFVLGDNRSASKDSRYFGPVSKIFVIGKIVFRGWPLSQITFFTADSWPQYKY